MRIISYLFAGLIFVTAQSAYAEVQVSKIFSSDMVLQRDKDVTVWGSAADKEKITVTIAGQTANAMASDGKWKVFPYANLYNQEGLPASPFRTDTYEIKMDQELADLQNRRLYLPRDLSRISWNIEQKKKVAAIHDQFITQEVEKKVLAMKARYTKLMKKKGRKSAEFKKAFDEYYSYLNPLLDKIRAEVSTAKIIEH